MTSNWSKTLKGRILKSLPFIWYVTWHGIRKSHYCGHGGHLRSRFRSWWGQMTSNWSKTLKCRILKSLPFIWYVTRHGLIFFDFFLILVPNGGEGGGRAQVNRAKKTPDFTEFSKNMDKIMPNGEKKSQKSQQTKSGTPPPPLNQPSGTPPLNKCFNFYTNFCTLFWRWARGGGVVEWSKICSVVNFLLSNRDGWFRP